MDELFRHLDILDPFKERFLSLDSFLKLPLDSFTIFPKQLTGRIFSYEARRKPGTTRSARFDAETGSRLSFDFNRDYAENILIHHEEGGGLKSLDAIRKFRVRNESASEILAQIPRLPGTYVACHIRNTDYTTDYKGFLSVVRGRLRGRPLLVCSDSRQVLDFAETEFSGSGIILFPPPRQKDNEPLHRPELSTRDFEARPEALRLLAEIFAMSKADEFFYTSVGADQKNPKVMFSGFSLLVANLVTKRNSFLLFPASMYPKSVKPGGRATRILSSKQWFALVAQKINSTKLVRILRKLRARLLSEWLEK